MSHCNNTKKGHGCLECTLERIADRIVASIEANGTAAAGTENPLRTFTDAEIATLKQAIAGISETVSPDSPVTLGQKIKSFFSR